MFLGLEIAPAREHPGLRVEAKHSSVKRPLYR